MQKKKEQSSLPWEHPKLEEEDPKALALIQTIKNSPSYRLAVKDEAFLESSEARSVRIELDYLKAELKMNELGIEHTIVVFGSARIVEKETAFKRLKSIQENLEKRSSDKKLLREFI